MAVLPHLVALFSDAGDQTASLSGVVDLSSVIGTTGDRPQVSYKINSNGEVQKAEGDTGSALSYVSMGNWLAGNEAPDDATDWECKYEITVQDVGDPGSFTGMTVSAWTDISTDPVITWTKDGTDEGTAGAEIVLHVRQKSDNNNSDSQSGLDMDCQITP